MQSYIIITGKNLGLAAAYFLSGYFGLSLAFVNANATAVWPPTGIALASVLLLGYRAWPGIFLGAFLVNLTTPATVVTAAAIAVGNMLEALVGAWLVIRFARGREVFDRPKTIAWFVLLAGMGSTAISATFGVTSLAVAGGARWENYASIWLTWWMGDMVSAIIITPLLVIWSSRAFARLQPLQILEMLLMLVLVALIGQFVFLGWLPAGIKNSPLEYLALPPLLWAAFRFGPRGASLAAFFTSGLALWGTLRGFGPFSHPGANESLLLLQAFMGAITVTGLILAAVVKEHRRAENYLRLQHAVSKVLAETPLLNDTIPKILEAICETTGWEWAAIWRLDKSAQELCCVQTWNVSGKKIPDLEAASRTRGFVKGFGLPGRIWAAGAPIWIGNISRDENLSRGPIALRAGLQSAFGFPIVSGSGSVEVLEFFSRDFREPDEDLIHLLHSLAGQIGQYLERQHISAALTESESRLQAILDNSTAVVYLKDLDGRHILINRHFDTLFQINNQKILGKTDAEIFPKEIAAALQANDEKVLQAGTSIEFEEIVLQADGPHTFLSIKFPLRDASGAISAICGISTDITERKKSEESLRSNEARKAAILQSSLDAIITIDQAGSILEFNPAAEQIFGFTRQEALGRIMVEVIVPPRLRQAHIRGMRHYLATGEGPLLNKRIETTAVRADGTEFPVELAINRIPMAGPPIFTGYIRDITERKQAEQALQEAKAQLRQYADELEGRVAERTVKLKETIQSLESFCYSIAHDLRSPLRAIQGFTKILKEDFAVGLGDTGEGYANRIITSATRMDQLIQDLLAYGRLSQVELSFTQVSLADVVEKALAQFNDEMKAKNATVEVSLESHHVWANDTVLGQILFNLIHNALKFMAPGVVPQLWIKVTASDDHVRLEVADNGIGIEPVFQEKIFKVFERLHSTEAYPGTGIGLAIVRKGVERMNGRVGVISELGKGSCFWIELPRPA